MKARIFQAQGRDEITGLEKKINGFLAELTTVGIVHHTDMAMCQVADGPNGERWQHLVITVWYDEK